MDLKPVPYFRSCPFTYKWWISVICLLVFTALGQGTHAQTIKAFETAGDKAIEEENYHAASQYYKEALSINNDLPEIHYKYAGASIQRKAFEEAEKSYRWIASRASAKKDFPLIYMDLGMVKKQLGDYEKAIRDLDRFIRSRTNEEDNFRSLAIHEKEKCIWALEKMNTPMQADLEILGDLVNSPFSEFSPFPMGDSLWFSSLKFDVPEVENVKVSRPLIYNGEKSTKQNGFAGGNTHAGHVKIEGRFMLFTRCTQITPSRATCKLYLREYSNGSWSRPKELEMPEEFLYASVTQPAFGIDPQTKQKVIYFSSNSISGKGGYDLWQVNWKDGSVSDPKNLDRLNTAANEYAPYFQEAKQTLWFSSESFQGFGGLDIFYSPFTEEDWTTPINAGYPINSSYDDLYFVMGNDPQHFWMTSNRKGTQSITEDEACCHDILKGFSERPLGPEPVPVDTPIVVDIPPIASVPKTPEPPEDPPAPPVVAAEILPISLYFHNDEPDSNTLRVTTRIDYESSYRYYISLKEKYKEEYGAGNLDLSKTIDVFFEEAVKGNFEKLNNFTELILKELKAGKKLEVGIRGYTSPRAPSQYNINLSKRRIDSAKLYFGRCLQGALQPYIESKNLTFTELPFGETKVPPGVEDSYSKPRLSIYSKEASQERRVEIAILNYRDN